MQNVIIAFPKEESSRKFKRILMQCGCRVSCICSSGSQVLNRAHELQYGIVLTGARMGDMTWQELRDDLPEGFFPVLLLPEIQAAELVPGAEGVFCLRVPFVIGELLQILKQAQDAAEAVRARDRDRPRKRSAEEVNTIRRAKELLMEKRQMTETTAHRYLQRRSMDSRCSLFACAQHVTEMLEKSGGGPSGE